MAQELDTVIQQAAVFLKEQGFGIFLGSDSGDKKLPEIVWDTNQGTWKDFLNVAKSNSIKSVVVDVQKLGKEHMEDIEDDADAVKKFTPYIGRYGSLSIFWVQDGVKYLYNDTTPWWDALSDEIGDEEEDFFEDDDDSGDDSDDDDTDDDSDDDDSDDDDTDDEDKL